MNLKPLSVSVVIPTYNRASLVERAVRSALAAVTPGDEIIVVDDGSTDNTKEVLSKFSNQIRYLMGRHEGAGPARNVGINASQGDLIAFLDSDDQWFADKLNLQRSLMQARPDIAFCFSDFSVQDETGKVFPRYLENWHKDPRPWEQILGPGFRYSSIAGLPAGREDFSIYVGDLYPELLVRPYIGTFTLMYRKALPGAGIMFPGDLRTFEDWQFFGELARRGPGAYLDCATATQHGHHMPRLTHAGGLIQTEARIKLLERVWGSDSPFLASHGDVYRQVLEDQRRQNTLYAAVEELKAGHMREARDQFAKLGHYPFRYRILQYLPTFIIRTLVRMRSARS